ncbi:hypothetical protein F383_14806 [Gossypium arboreum]|uniref:Uncharacterized protein n=1 Tax=Gossypium arboreum TaxID=29729 RepID=A0A0B0PX62_GOSAR|nr:hypothetical protein F383_14806 [Gossypium arboreum]
MYIVGCQKGARFYGPADFQCVRNIWQTRRANATGNYPSAYRTHKTKAGLLDIGRTSLKDNDV